MPTEQKHTPGPWNVLDRRAYTQSLSRWTIMQTYGHNHMIAKTIGEYESVNEEANARLIAAAPDLLEALESADLSTTQIRLAADIGRKSAKDKVNWYESQLTQLGREIRAAIAKATESEG